MTRHSILALAVACALTAGCGRDPETAGDLEQSAPETAAEQAGVAEISPPVDDPTNGFVAPRPEAARSPAGRDPERPERSAPSPTVGEGRLPARMDAPPTGDPGSAAPAGTTQERQPDWREVTLPAGTTLPLELMTALSSETARLETPVRARLRQAVLVDGATALPAGAVLMGHVTEAERAGRVQGRSRLVFRFNQVEVSGAREDIRTNPIAFEGEATTGEDATRIGAGAIGGGIIGGILGGGDGAAKGAAIGGAAGTGVVLATRGREVSLASGANIAASLAEPFTIQVSAR